MLLGIPLDFLGVVGEITTYLLLPVLSLLAFPFLIVVDTYHGQQLQELLHVYHNTLLPWLVRALL